MEGRVEEGEVMKRMVESLKEEKGGSLEEVRELKGGLERLKKRVVEDYRNVIGGVRLAVGKEWFEGERAAERLKEYCIERWLGVKVRKGYPRCMVGRLKRVREEYERKWGEVELRNLRYERWMKEKLEVWGNWVEGIMKELEGSKKKRGWRQGRGLD